jgi:hypothetical protein
VGCGHRQADLGGEGQVQGGGNDGTHHAEHEHGGAVRKLLGVDDLGADRVSDAGTHPDGTTKLHDGRDHHGLEILDGPRRHRGCPCVGHIVGTDIPGIEEGEYGAKGEEVVKLVERHLEGPLAG